MQSAGVTTCGVADPSRIWSMTFTRFDEQKSDMHFVLDLTAKSGANGISRVRKGSLLSLDETRRQTRQKIMSDGRKVLSFPRFSSTSAAVGVSQAAL